MRNIFKKFAFWLPIIYLLIILIDLGLDLTDYQILVMFTSPLMWFNFFQHPDTFTIAIIISLGIWILVGFLIDLSIKKLKG